MGTDVESQRIPATIARELGRKIVSGALPPGTMLDGEMRASEQLHVSRTAYREAVGQLVAKGLVESRPKVGTVVSEQRYWHLLDTDVLAWIFEFEAEHNILCSLLEMRRLIEPEAAALAASRRSEADLMAMRAALDAMAEHKLTTPEGQLADERFHLALLDASGNIFLRSISGAVSAALQWTNILRKRANDQPCSVEDHRGVYHAVAAGDAATARRAMLQVIEFTAMSLMRKEAEDPNNPDGQATSEVVVMRSHPRARRA